MAKSTDHPVTQAVRVLRQAAVVFTPHVFAYEARGGTKHSADVLGVDEHCVIKTLILEDDTRQPLCVLMHGDHEVSTKGLARLIGARRIEPCVPAQADKHSGYQVGGTSPFGLKRAMPLYMQETIASLPLVYINGGARGFLVSLAPNDIVRVLKPTLVAVAVPHASAAPAGRSSTNGTEPTEP